MPPIFSSRSNTFVRVSIVVGLIAITAIVGYLVWWTHSSTFNQVGVKVPQPVPFPHNFHVAVLGLNCRYCHTGVDKAAFADLPPTETCMSCHSQIATNDPALAPVRDSWKTGKPIAWNKVYQVPDYVYFNHQAHVGKGVACETCHGRVDQMTTAVKANAMYMSFCVDCHRDPAQYVRPRANVYDMGYKPDGDQHKIGEKLVKDYAILPPTQLMNCSICHR